MDLSQFDNFKIQPCVLLNEQGQPIHVSYEPCEPGDPDLAEYVLYGRTPGQGVTALADFASKELAEMVRAWLTQSLPPIYAAVNMQADHVDYRLPANGPIWVNTFYRVVIPDGEVCTDLDWAARQVIDERHEHNNPNIQLYQLVPVDPSVAQAALAQAERAWAADNGEEDSDDDRD